MKNFEQWGGFEGRIWKEEINVRDFTIPRMRETNPSWRDPQRQLTNYGEFCRDCRKKSVQKAAFWIWILILYPASHPMEQDISVKKPKILSRS